MSALFDKDGYPLRRVMGFRGGHLEPEKGQDWVVGSVAQDRIRLPEENWRPGGKQWEPLCRKREAAKRRA